MNAPIPVPLAGQSFGEWLGEFEPALAARVQAECSARDVEVFGDGFRYGMLSALHQLYRLRHEYGPEANLLAAVHASEEALLARRRSVIAASLVSRLTKPKASEGQASAGCGEPCACWQDGYEAGFDDALDDTPEKP